MQSSMTQHYIMLLTLLSIFMIGCSVMEQPLASDETSFQKTAQQDSGTESGAISLDELEKSKEENSLFDEVTITINSRQQPPNMKVGDRVDLFGKVPVNRSEVFIYVLEAVDILSLGDDVVEGQVRGNKYGSITIALKPDQTSLLFDIQQRVDDQQFYVIRRAPGDTGRRTKTANGEINPEVLRLLCLE